MSSVINRLPFSYSSLPAAWRKIADSVNRAITVLQEHEDAVDPHPQYVPEGFGGIYRETPDITLNGNLSTTPTPIPGVNYTTELSPSPVGVTQDLANGQITITERGIWLAHIGVTLAIDQVTANASNTVLVAAYDVLAATQGDQPLAFTVPRYGESVFLSGTFPVRVDAALVNRPFALAIWIINASPAINVTSLNALDFHVTRVAREGAL